MLIMSLTDQSTDPTPSIRNLTSLLLQKYTVHAENVQESVITMLLYWFKLAEREISIASNEEIISYVLQLKSLMQVVEENYVETMSVNVGLRQQKGVLEK